MAVRVLQNLWWACEVLPALCTPGLMWRVLRRPEVIACLLWTIVCAVAVAADHCLVGFFGGTRGREKKAQKAKRKLRMSSSYWQQRGRDSSVARPDPLLTVECFSSLRSQKFSMESGLPHECVLRPQRSRRWSWQNKIKIIQNTHVRARAW